MSERMRRVNESVRQVVAEALPELKDPRIGLVTITGVVTSPDLRVATVYVSRLRHARKRRATLDGPQGAARPPAQDEADSRIDVRVRSLGRAWRADDTADRRAGPRR